MLTSYLYVFLKEMSIQIILLIFNWLFLIFIIEDYFLFLKILWISGKATSSGSTISPKSIFFMYLISAPHSTGFVLSLVPSSVEKWLLTIEVLGFPLLRLI